MLGSLADAGAVQGKAAGDDLREFFGGGREAAETLFDNFGNGTATHRGNGCAAEHCFKEDQAEGFGMLDWVKQSPRTTEEFVAFGGLGIADIFD